MLLERMVEDALRRHLVTERALRGEASSRRQGLGPLRALLVQREGPALTRSEAEWRLTELIRRAFLPQPDHNVVVDGLEVDMYWPDHGLVVEIDGWAFHNGREAFERDRLRDARLVAKGIRVMRITWRQIVHEPPAVVARLAAALAR